MRALIYPGAFGLALGFALTRIGFADFQAVHAMFLLTDLRLVFTFAGGVALSFVGFRIAAKGVALEPKPLHRGVLPGAALFGAGWAITGACPGVVLVQLGAGQLLAGVTLVGLIAGNLLAAAWQARARPGPAAAPEPPPSTLIRLGDARPVPSESGAEA